MKENECRSCILGVKVIDTQTFSTPSKSRGSRAHLKSATVKMSNNDEIYAVQVVKDLSFVLKGNETILTWGSATHIA